MKHVVKLLALALLFGTSLNANAWFSNNGGDWNPWPAWTPMYWMEEMVGGDDYYGYGGPYGYTPYNSYGPYGYGNAPYSGYRGPYTPPYGGYPFNSYPAPYYANPWRY